MDIMKKMIIMAALLVTAVTAWAQRTALADTPLEDIEQGWMTKTIDQVTSGTMEVMMDRFNQTWPTWMVGLLKETMEKGLEKEVIDDETGLTVTIDRKNGYVEVNDGGTDGAYMAACYWNRSNGHKLLAINLGKPTDPFIDFACFYDYNPQQMTLTPEPEILKGYRWSDREQPYQIFCQLPKKGKDVVVEEWRMDGPVHHTFTWDGMQPVYAKTEPFDMEDEQPFDGYTVEFTGAEPTIKDFVEALLAPEDIGEALNALKFAWGFYKEGMTLPPGESLTVDKDNGYMGYESLEEEKERMVIECCYWNFADKQHKLVALSNDVYTDGKAFMGQYSGVEFFIYDKDTQKLQPVYTGDYGAEIDTPENMTAVTHALPRTGKTIVFTIHTPSGKTEKRLTWNGERFVE